jgi:uncharacterized protein (TIGR03032 family)
MLTRAPESTSNNVSVQHVRKADIPPDAGVQTRQPPPVQSLVELSPGFVSWMIRYRISLACTASNLGHLLLIGSRSNGTPGVSRAQFSGARGIAAFSHRIYLADRTSIWRLENTLRSREIVADQFDRLFVPRNAQITSDIGAHELAVEPSGRVIVVATKYSCLATLSATHAFKPLWKPAFVSKLAPEDRCHLNGLGMENGHARYVTACSTADIVDGWRDHRASGGVLIDLTTDRVLTNGLSMPHSPRSHRGSAWVLNSGSGHLCRIDPQTGRRENVAFCPGFLRGLTFVEHFAIATLSLPRHGRFQGLELDNQLTHRQATPWCGLVVIDTRNGDVVEWLRLGAEFSELFDVAVVPATRCAVAIAPDSPVLQDAVTFEHDFAPLAPASRDPTREKDMARGGGHA